MSPLVQRELRKLSDPRYLRENGIVVARQRIGPHELYIEPGLVYVTA